MANYICEHCGAEFQAKPSEKRKYCGRVCSYAAAKGKPQSKRKENVEVVCAECGKIELVLPSRSKKYLCCSVDCLGKYNSKRYSKKIQCVCPICNSDFELKPFTFNKILSTPCCCKECADKLKSTTYLGEKNHQFGLKGELNSSFKGQETLKKNHKLKEIMVYAPNRPDCDKTGRVTKHRLLVEEEYENFNPIYFDSIGEFMVLKDGISVHHINQNHDDNRIENLMPLTKRGHTKIHNNLESLAQQAMLKLTGVVKQGELLETPEEDNQQPSLDSNIFEGSETNNQSLLEITKGSNVDTSALLNDILYIIDDYIVRAANITKEIAELDGKELLG